MELSRSQNWWKNVLKLKPASFGFKGAAPTWEKLPLVEKAEFVHHVLPLFGEVYPFSLNLNPDLEAKAKRQTKMPTTDWLERIIVRDVELTLGRKVIVVCFWEEEPEHAEWQLPDETITLTGSIEWEGKTVVLDGESVDVEGESVVVEKDRRLHCHGYIVLLNDNELPAAYEGLQRAGGPWKSRRGKKRQLDLDPAKIYPDHGWLSYCAKDFELTTLRDRRERPAVVSFTGSPFYAPEPVMQLARLLFEECRRQYEDQRKAGKPRRRINHSRRCLPKSAPGPRI